MSVKKDPSGRRSVQVEVEVPGTPEEVWQAIATGPGISSWFVPTRFEKGDDGKPVKVILSFGPGMDSSATITHWDPPLRFAAESGDWGPDAPPVATEWIVEARSGGVCVVRVVHSLFASGDDWDDQLEGTESGWPGYFRILRIYMSHFRGQPCSIIPFTAFAPEPVSEAWSALSGALGLADVAPGERRSAPAGTPSLAGLVEFAAGADQGGQILLRLDEPVPGIAHLQARSMGGQVMLAMRAYLYGDEATVVAARDEPLWQKWAQEQFPPMGESSG